MHSLILRDARLVPVDSPAPTEPMDVLVEDCRVVEVGPTLHRPEGVEEVRADGRWLIPGLWDQHVHLAQWTLTSGRLDLAGARSPEINSRTRSAPREPRERQPEAARAARKTSKSRRAQRRDKFKDARRAERTPQEAAGSRAEKAQPE